MLNTEQAQYEHDERTKDAKKALIREALKQGPGFAKDISQRIGEPSNVVVRLLHEMEDDMVISFTWLRGYKL